MNICVIGQRKVERATELGNYDPTREHLNFEVVSGGKDPSY